MLASNAQASAPNSAQSNEIGDPKVSAHKMNWLRKLLYEWSCHTDIEQALDDKLAMGKRIGRDYCPRCEITRLVEIELGLFTCPYCRMDTDADIYLSTPPEIMRIRTGALARAYPLKVDTQQIEAIRAKNGPAYQQRLTQRLQWQHEEERKA